VSAQEKSEILALVAYSGLPRRRALAWLGLPKSTYYRWPGRQAEGRLQDKKGGSSLPWNKLRPEEEAKIVVQARDASDLSCRQIALRLVDSRDFYVSESTVFRVLKREGLIKPAEIVGFKAAKEYHRKTTAVDSTGMTDVPVENRTTLLSDNGAGYISRRFGEYLRLVEIRHITASPYHPQTNGKIERYHRTIKGELSLLLYEMPTELEQAVRAFVEYYNYRRYHEGLGDVTPHDVYVGRYPEILQTRKEAKSKTLKARKDYNRTAREQGAGL
jgi:transposase InsO family protein